MKIGTKSVLFGAHCFFIHPIFVFIAWWKLYGFPFDPRLWIAFFVHDLGYIGKSDMDGADGETHVELGAKIMSVFGENWANFSMYHSRFYAKRDNMPVSHLCVADKLAFCIEPRWFYLLRVSATGEIKEYMSAAKNGDNKYQTTEISTESKIKWFNTVKRYLLHWIEAMMTDYKSEANKELPTETQEKDDSEDILRERWG